MRFILRNGTRIGWDPLHPDGQYATYHERCEPDGLNFDFTGRPMPDITFECYGCHKTFTSLKRDDRPPAVEHFI